jgi:hypothetical protein
MESPSQPQAAGEAPPKAGGETIPASMPNKLHREVSTTRPLEEALRRMQECSRPALAVVDRWGRVAGLVTPESIGELMLIQSVAPRGGARSWHPAAER